jgi:hypothetical protein
VSLARFAVVTAHLILAAVWLGAMSYSIAVVQPKLLALAGSPEDAEETMTFVAAGARPKVLAVIGLLAGTGASLVALADPADRGRSWWVLVGAKVVLLVAASVVFWRVSWHMWPRRAFALPSEVPVEQAAFRRVGWTLIVLVGSASVAGVALRFVT